MSFRQKAKILRGKYLQIQLGQSKVKIVVKFLYLNELKKGKNLPKKDNQWLQTGKFLDLKLFHHFLSVHYLQS